MKNDARRISVIDFETDPFKHGRFPRAFSVGYYDGRTYSYKWGTHGECVEWAAKRCKEFCGIVFAHNGGKFDFLAFLLGQGGSLLWGEPVFCIGGRIVSVQYGKAEFRDSYAILPAPLKAYDKGEVDYKWFEKEVREKHKKRILEYLKRDVLSLYNLVFVFVSKYGYDVLTAASAAIRQAKEMGIEPEKLYENRDISMRKYYRGGLVLARKPGIHYGSFKLFDIKSAYPYAMLSQHCFGRDFTFDGKVDKVVTQGFYTVEGSATECFLRSSKTGNTFGGDGIFYTTGWELAEALRWKRFRGKVIMGEIPTILGDFRPYVDYHFSRKQEAEKSGDKAGRLIEKIMLNALYGKYAQNPSKYRNYFLMPQNEPLPEGNEELADESPRRFRIEAEFDEAKIAVWSTTSVSFHRYNVATAASITGYVRAMLMRAIYETDCYYCDTDSVITRSINKPTNLGVEIGNWTEELCGDVLYIAGKKLYAMRIFGKYSPKTEEDSKLKGLYWDGKHGWKIASKGCHLTPDQMKRLCQGQSIYYKNDAPSYSLLNKPFFVKRTITATA
jgi:DNA polymerase type B, organellar and viral